MTGLLLLFVYALIGAVIAVREWRELRTEPEDYWLLVAIVLVWPVFIGVWLAWVDRRRR